MAEAKDLPEMPEPISKPVTVAKGSCPIPEQDDFPLQCAMSLAKWVTKGDFDSGRKEAAGHALSVLNWARCSFLDDEASPFPIGSASIQSRAEQALLVCENIDSGAKSLDPVTILMFARLAIEVLRRFFV